MPRIRVRKDEDGSLQVEIRGRMHGRAERRVMRASDKKEAKTAVKELIAQWDADKSGNVPV